MSLFLRFTQYIKQDQAAVLVTVVRGPATLLGQKALLADDGRPTGPLLETPWREPLLADAADLLRQRSAGTRRYPPLTAGEPEIELFFDVHRPAPRLVIVGGVHIAVDLIHLSRPLGFITYLVDPRTAFASPERFPHADHIINRWPDEALPELGLTGDTAVVVVTHDPKLDDPALLAALPSRAFYVGALGSPKTHARRVERLLSLGMSRTHIDRLHAPIGLNIGGRTPAEIALSIMAQIVAVRNGMLEGVGA